MKQVDGITSCYLRAAFDRKSVKRIVKSFKQAVKDNVFGDFDTIAVRGLSGLVFGQTLAYAVDKNLLIIRKKDESSHSDYEIEGFTEIKNYIIVDDFINTGRTVGTIAKETKTHVNFLNCGTIIPKLVGCFLWNTSSYNPGYTLKANRSLNYYDYKEWESIPLVCYQDFKDSKELYKIEYAYNCD